MLLHVHFLKSVNENSIAEPYIVLMYRKKEPQLVLLALLKIPNLKPSKIGIIVLFEICYITHLANILI